MYMSLINEITRIRQVMGLNEEVETKGVQFDSSEKKIIDDFVEFVKKELDIKNDVNVHLQGNKDGIKTTADEANAVAGEMIKKYGIKNPEIYPEDFEGEIGEQEEGGGGETSSSSSNVTKWETGVTRGPANTLTVSVWDSGVTRGRGNPIDQNKKWESGASRGKANPLT
jgi:hypothetical protein